MKKIVIAPDSFKGTLSAGEVCRAIAAAAGRVFPAAEILCLPLADGGEGTTDCFAALPGSRRAAVTVTGPLGDPVKASYVLTADGTAVVETAGAAGLGLVRGREDPLGASTYGVGEMIRHGIKSGARKVLIGLGGSCTTDGGAGAASALGVRFYDESERAFLPTGGTLDQIAGIDPNGIEPAVKETEFVLLCDVKAPLYGKDGAAYVFAPQKGANPAQAALLDRGLRHLGAIYDGICPGVSSLPGAGAAGGLGAGMTALFGGKIVPGIEAVLDAIGADAAFAGADLIVTGEGKLDEQTFTGKAVSGVVRRAKSVPVIAAAGVVDCPDTVWRQAGLRAVFGVHPAPVSPEEAEKNAFEDLEKTAERAFQSCKEMA